MNGITVSARLSQAQQCLVVMSRHVVSVNRIPLRIKLFDKCGANTALRHGRVFAPVRVLNLNSKTVKPAGTQPVLRGLCGFYATYVYNCVTGVPTSKDVALGMHAGP